MLKNSIIHILGLAVLLNIQCCSNTEDTPKIYHDNKSGIIISYKGLDNKYPIDSKTDIFASPSFSIDSINRVVYFNNYNKEFIAFSLENSKELGSFKLKNGSAFSLGENRAFKIRIALNKNIVLLNSNRNLWVFDLKLSKLYANYIDSVQIIYHCKNLGHWDYSIQNDSLIIKLQKDTSIYMQGEGGCRTRYSFMLPKIK